MHQNGSALLVSASSNYRPNQTLGRLPVRANSLPESSRAVDVGEEECGDPGAAFRHGVLRVIEPARKSVVPHA